MTISKIMHSLDKHLSTIGTLRGWKRYGLAILAGVCATLAMAPYYVLPLLIAGYITFATLLHGDGLDNQPKPLRRAFLTGWAFGFGYFISGIYWMGFAFLVRAEEFAWMIPIAIPAFAAFLGLFFAFPAFLFTLIRQKTKIVGWQLSLILAANISFFEYLRGHILTGLPWNLTGQAMTGWIAGAQSASLFGVYGLGLVVLTLSCMPGFSTRNSQSSFAMWIVSIGGFFILYIFGAIWLSTSPTQLNNDVIVSVVQPNISQKDKINSALVNKNFNTLMSLSAAGSAGREQNSPAHYMIWPENAISWLDEQPVVLDIISKNISSDTIILTGSLRRDYDKDGKQRYFNTMAIVEEKAGTRTVTGFYDKHHLVPFGEYLPLKGFLTAVGLSQLAPVEDGFTPGIGPQTFNIGASPFAPLICYETIFPGAMHPGKTRPEWLVTVTNDAWFGDDAGPKQHLDQARLRSIETGLPMVRSANTGISSVIDPNGRVLAKIDLYKQGVIDHALPHAKQKTIYAQLGDWPYFLMLILSLCLGLGESLRMKLDSIRP